MNDLRRFLGSSLTIWPLEAVKITLSARRARCSPHLGAHVRENVDKRSSAKHLQRQSAHLDGFLLSDGAAVHGPQEVIQQSLPGRGIVEYIADERGLRGRL